jgi:adenylate cyclase
MNHDRRLAAIMFTDIQGYSATMQRNEEEAFRLRTRHREILNREHANFNGQVIQYYGDGTLSIFPSAVQAVRCALQMQLEYRREPEVPVRIGLHMGDIVFDDGQIFGDGVNLASRIESLGFPGGVLMSDRIRQEVHNQPELPTISLGTFQLKNIERPVEVFSLQHTRLAMPPAHLLQAKAEQVKSRSKRAGGFQRASMRHKAGASIAVLPFKNMSNDPEQDYFGEGVAEDILNSLSTVEQLKVAGRASSFRFRGDSTDLREIGEKLGVSNVLEGSIRKQSNRIRVTVQLTDIKGGFQIWSDRYDRYLDDIFAVQDEIATAVTERLKVTLLGNRNKLTVKPVTSNTEAYELYLKGRFHMNRRAGGIATGIKYFQLAIELDPNFALAYAGFADAYLMAASYGVVSPIIAGARAKEAAEKAISLNADFSEPYCSLAFYYTCCEWNWQEAERNFLRALELNPSNAQAHYWYGLNFLCWSMGDFTNGENHGRMAVELEPLSSICYGILGPILHVQRKYEETVAVCMKGLEIDPNAFLCALYLGIAHTSLKQHRKAITILNALVINAKRHHFALAALAMAYIGNSEFELALELYEELKKRSTEEYVTPTLVGIVAGYLNKTEESREYLEKGYENRDPVLLSIKYESWVSPSLRQDAYFNNLLERIGFPVH